VASPADAPDAAANTDAIATVGETAISRDKFVSLLIRSRGVPVLEQFVGLAAAEEYATKRGVGITDSDVEFEYELALRRLSDPQAFNTSEGFDTAEAERLLDSILLSRYMSRPEFMLSVRRNALLRKALAAETTITDEALREEYDLAYGDRVQVRHIQLGNLNDATRIKERLAAGEEFADLAARYSTNAATARRGGLLDPFSLRDENIPLAMRQTASKLTASEVSEAVRVGEWYHLLKLEKQVPPDKRDFESVRAVLQKRMEVRLTDARMRDLHEKLFKEAAVEISDPQLRDAYQAAHRQSGGSASLNTTTLNFLVREEAIARFQAASATFPPPKAALDQAFTPVDRPNIRHYQPVSTGFPLPTNHFSVGIKCPKAAPKHSPGLAAPRAPGSPNPSSDRGPTDNRFGRSRSPRYLQIGGA
jgi:foldase protein PrsA